MEKIGQKSRNISFYSEKNGKMICLHSRHARDYAKYLEAQSWVERYEAGPPLSQELYAHVSSVGIRGAYASDFLIHFVDGRNGIRELVAADGLRRKNIVEKLEFSRKARRKIMCKRYSTKSRKGAVKTEQNGGCIRCSPLVPEPGAVCAPLAA